MVSNVQTVLAEEELAYLRGTRCGRQEREFVSRYRISHLQHTSLGLMDQYIEALDEYKNDFKYICEVFSHLSSEKFKAEFFDDSLKRHLIK